MSRAALTSLLYSEPTDPPTLSRARTEFAPHVISPAHARSPTLAIALDSFTTPDGVFDGHGLDQFRLYNKHKGRLGSNASALLGCRALSEGVQKPQILVNVSAILSRASSRRLTVLDLWTPTRNLSIASHPIHSPPGALTIPDCAHYCQWLGIDAAVLQAVAWAANESHHVRVASG